jgi:glucose-6-phosphate 1-dehydrogenase
MEPPALREPSLSPHLRPAHTLFTTAAGIERLWEVSAPLLDAPPDVRHYAPGSWGPDEIHDLIAPNRWRLPFERRWREAEVIVER